MAASTIGVIKLRRENASAIKCLILLMIGCLAALPASISGTTTTSGQQHHSSKIVKRFAIASVLNPSAVAGNNGVRLFPGPRRALIGNVARYASAASSLIPMRSSASSDSYATRRSSASSFAELPQYDAIRHHSPHQLAASNNPVPSSHGSVVNGAVNAASASASEDISIRRSYQSDAAQDNAADISFPAAYPQQQQQSYQKPKTLDSYDRPATLSPLLLGQSSSNNPQLQHYLMRQQQQKQPQFTATTRQPQHIAASSYQQQQQQSTTRAGYDQIPAPKQPQQQHYHQGSNELADYSSSYNDQQLQNSRQKMAPSPVASLTYQQRNHEAAQPADMNSVEPALGLFPVEQQSPIHLAPKNAPQLASIANSRQQLEPAHTNQFERRSLVPSYQQPSAVPTIYGRQQQQQQSQPQLSNYQDEQSDYPPAGSAHLHSGSEQSGINAAARSASRYTQDNSYNSGPQDNSANSDQSGPSGPSGYSGKAQEGQSNQPTATGESADESAEQTEAQQNKPDKLALLLLNSKFLCTGRKDGYYADNSVQCQAFHYCVSGAKHSWMCPEGTVFHQVHLNCVPASQDICDQSEKYHMVNDYLYKPMDSNGPNATVRYHQRYYPEEFTYGMPNSPSDPNGGESQPPQSAASYNDDTGNSAGNNEQPAGPYRPVPVPYPTGKQLARPSTNQQNAYASRAQQPDHVNNAAQYNGAPAAGQRNTAAQMYPPSNSYGPGSTASYNDNINNNNADSSSNLDSDANGDNSGPSQYNSAGPQNDAASSSPSLSTLDNGLSDADSGLPSPPDSYSTRTSMMSSSPNTMRHQQHNDHYDHYNPSQQYSGYSPSQPARSLLASPVPTGHHQLVSQRQRLTPPQYNSKLAAINGVPQYGSAAPSHLQSSYNSNRRHHQLSSSSYSPYDNSNNNAGGMQLAATNNNNFQVQNPPHNVNMMMQQQQQQQQQLKTTQQDSSSTTTPSATTTSSTTSTNSMQPVMSNNKQQQSGNSLQHIDIDKLATLKELAARLIPHMSAQSLSQSAIANTKKQSSIYSDHDHDHNNNSDQLMSSSTIDQQEVSLNQQPTVSSTSSSPETSMEASIVSSPSNAATSSSTTTTTTTTATYGNGQTKGKN